MCHIQELLARRGLVHLAPQVVGDGIAVSVSADVGTHAVAPRIRADVILQHADHRRALAVGDAIKCLAGLLHRRHVLHDRVRGDIGVLPHRATADARSPDTVEIPFRMQLVRGAAGHPGGEAFVEPQVVPPRHRHQVAEPLVRDFMRGNAENALLVRHAGHRRIDQQRVLEGEDRAPVFHRAEELAAARRGDVVELGQRIGHAEIVVVFVNHIATGLQREARLLDLAGLRDHPDLGAVVGGERGAFELTGRHEQQIRRHLRRGLEHHLLQPIAQRLAAGLGHVADRHLRGRHIEREVERRLVTGLIPRRHETTCIGVFKLREQRALLAAVGGVIQREQTIGLRVDDAAVVGTQRVAARHERLVERERRRLVGFIDADPGRQRSALPCRQLAVGETQRCGLQHDAVGRRQHVQFDADLAVEGHLLGMRRDFHAVMQRTRSAWQLRGYFRYRRRRRRLHLCVDRNSTACQRQRDGGYQGTTHQVPPEEMSGLRNPQASDHRHRPPRHDSPGSHGCSGSATASTARIGAASDEVSVHHAMRQLLPLHLVLRSV
ncbi:hypothetical protein D3C71_1036830 [compost metagenome]